MNSNKLPLIVLILIAAIFAAFVIWGSLKPDHSPRSNRNETNNFTKDKAFTAWKTWFDNSLAWLRPKAKLPCGPSGEPSEKCENLQLKSSFLVLPDNTQSFRTANFKLVNGSANICYRTNENAPSCADAKDLDKNAKPNLEAQSFDLPDADAENPQRGTIVVLKKGGKITVICKSIPCQVDLE